MFIASLSLASAGIVEVFRIKAKKSINNTISELTVVGRDISIFYQVPQFGLMGISEILVLITGRQYAQRVMLYDSHFSISAMKITVV